MLFFKARLDASSIHGSSAYPYHIPRSLSDIQSATKKEIPHTITQAVYSNRLKSQCNSASTITLSSPLSCRAERSPITYISPRDVLRSISITYNQKIEVAKARLLKKQTPRMECTMASGCKPGSHARFCFPGKRGKKDPCRRDLVVNRTLALGVGHFPIQISSR